MITFMILMSLPVLVKSTASLGAAFHPTPLLDSLDYWAGPAMLTLYSVAFLSVLLVSLFSPQPFTMTAGILAGLVSATVTTVSTSRD